MKKEGKAPDLIEFAPHDHATTRVVWSVLHENQSHDLTDSVVEQLDSLSVSPSNVASISPLVPSCPRSWREAPKDCSQRQMG